jgi:hypothetical protein
MDSASWNDVRRCFPITWQARHSRGRGIGRGRGRGHVRGHGHGRSTPSNTDTVPTRAIQSHGQGFSSTTCEEYGTPTIPLALSHSSVPTLTKQRRNRQFRKLTKSCAVDSVGLGDRRGCDECKELLESEQWLAL